MSILSVWESIACLPRGISVSSFMATPMEGPVFWYIRASCFSPAVPQMDTFTPSSAVSTVTVRTSSIISSLR